MKTDSERINQEQIDSIERLYMVDVQRAFDAKQRNVEVVERGSKAEDFDHIDLWYHDKEKDVWCGVDVKGFSMTNNCTNLYFRTTNTCRLQWGDDNLNIARKYHSNTTNTQLVLPIAGEDGLWWLIFDKARFAYDVDRLATNRRCEAKRNTMLHEHIPLHEYRKPRSKDDRLQISVSVEDLKSIARCKIPRSQEIVTNSYTI